MDIEKLKSKRQVMKTSITKFITKIDTFIEAIDFKKIEQLTEC